MIRASRRNLLKGSAVIGLTGAVPVAAASLRQRDVRLLVFDSRVPESQAFAAGAGPGHRLDLAGAHESQWAELRGSLPQFTRVEGLTGWSDWIAVRGELESRGHRLSAENQVAAPLSGKANLFRWSMKAR